MNYDPSITVCSACFHACCWQGEFMCGESYGANIVPRKISTLLRVQGEYHEHPDWWNNDLRMESRPALTVEDLQALGVTDPDYLELAQ